MPISIRVTALSIALAGVVGVSSSHAATTADQFKVSITLENSCQIFANDLPFGTTASIKDNIDAQTSVRVRCTGANPVSIGFDVGTGGGTIADRKLKSTTSADTVDYNLYADPGRTIVLGAINAISFTSTGNDQEDTRDVYGRVPGQAPKPNGTYESDVTATLTF